MKKNNHLGKVVFENFKQEVSSNSDWFDVSSIERVGSRLIVESHKVSKSFVDQGFDLAKGAFGMNVFRPNIKMQDYGVEAGEIKLVNLSTTQARASVNTDHITKYPTVREQMKKLGKNENDIYTCVIEATIREMMQVSYVGGLELGEKANNAAAFSVLRRAALINKDFRESIEASGVDWTWDVAGVAQFSKEIDFDGFIQDLYASDPYFNRRADIIDCARFESSYKSAEMKELGKNTLNDDLIKHLYQKSKKIEPWLKRALGRALS